MEWSYPLLPRHNTNLDPWRASCSPDRGYSSSSGLSFRNLQFQALPVFVSPPTPLPPHIHSSGVHGKLSHEEGGLWFCWSGHTKLQWFQMLPISPVILLVPKSPSPVERAEASPQDHKAPLLWIWTCYMLTCQWRPKSKRFRESYIA